MRGLSPFDDASATDACLKAKAKTWLVERTPRFGVNRPHVGTIPIW